MLKKHVMPTPPLTIHLLTQVWHKALPYVFVIWVSGAGRFVELQLHGWIPVTWICNCMSVNFAHVCHLHTFLSPSYMSVILTYVCHLQTCLSSSHMYVAFRHVCHLHTYMLPSHVCVTLTGVCHLHTSLSSSYMSVTFTPVWDQYSNIIDYLIRSWWIYGFVNIFGIFKTFIQWTFRIFNILIFKYI